MVQPRSVGNSLIHLEILLLYLHSRSDEPVSTEFLQCKYSRIQKGFLSRTTHFLSLEHSFTLNLPKVLLWSSQVPIYRPGIRNWYPLFLGIFIIYLIFILQNKHSKYNWSLILSENWVIPGCLDQFSLRQFDVVSHACWLLFKLYVDQKWYAHGSTWAEVVQGYLPCFLPHTLKVYSFIVFDPTQWSSSLV